MSTQSHSSTPTNYIIICNVKLFRSGLSLKSTLIIIQRLTLEIATNVIYKRKMAEIAQRRPGRIASKSLAMQQCVVVDPVDVFFIHCSVLYSVRTFTLLQYHSTVHTA